MEVQHVFKVLASVAAIGFLGFVLRMYDSLVRKPNEVRKRLNEQGVGGPKPLPILGNLLDMRRANEEEPTKSRNNNGPQVFHSYSGGGLLPFFENWRKQYGNLFTFAMGKNQVIHVTRPDIVKEITQSVSINLGRPYFHSEELGPLFGDGILTSNGPSWQYQKKILAPDLQMDKVKGMNTLVWESVSILLESWKAKIEAGGEGGVADLHVDQDLLDCSGDVISRACFGSNYSNGKEIFCKLNVLKEAMSKRILSMGIPGLSKLPTKNNRDIWRLVKEIHTLVVKIVKERKESGHAHNDLLQTILYGSENTELNPHGKEQFIVDNCKTIYLAAQETVAITAAWSLVLLASNPDWQDRVRAEVLEIWGTGGQVPDSEKLRKVKLLTMVIQETLRLYPPGVALSREALTEFKIGGIGVPQGVSLWVMVTKLHTDPETWGPDSFTFNPERFANGVSGACKLPQSYMPFGFGPRVCLGQNLAMLEMKMILGLILTNFSFSLSPSYVHSPLLKLVIEPKHGINLLFKKI